jgi:hypothetical protein
MKIREQALYNYRNASVSRDLSDSFLAACWVEAVLTELKRNNLISDEIDFTLILDNVKIGEIDD